MSTHSPRYASSVNVVKQTTASKHVYTHGPLCIYVYMCEYVKVLENDPETYLRWTTRLPLIIQHISSRRLKDAEKKRLWNYVKYVRWMFQNTLTDFEVLLHEQSKTDNLSVSELRGGKQETTILWNNWKVLTDWFSVTTKSTTINRVWYLDLERRNLNLIYFRILIKWMEIILTL
jgi:hypothetical protein